MAKNNFTKIPNHIIQGKTKISLKAFRVYCYILSLPKDWNTNQRKIAKVLDLSLDTVTKAIKELRDNDLLEMNVSNNENGRGKVTTYQKPCTEKQDIPCTENQYKEERPCTEKPCTEKPCTENQYTYKDYNNKDFKTTKTNTNKEKNKQKRIDDYFGDVEVNVLFNEFLELRTKLKAKNTDRAIMLLVNKIKDLSKQQQIETINASIESSWKGLFPKQQKSDKEVDWKNL